MNPSGFYVDPFFHDCLFLVNNKFQFPIRLYRRYIHKYKLYFGNQS